MKEGEDGGKGSVQPRLELGSCSKEEGAKWLECVINQTQNNKKKFLISRLRDPRTLPLPPGPPQEDRRAHVPDSGVGQTPSRAGAASCLISRR